MGGLAYREIGSSCPLFLGDLEVEYRERREIFHDKSVEIIVSFLCIG